MSGKAQGDEAIQARENQKKKRLKDFKEVFDLFDSDGGVRHPVTAGWSLAALCQISPGPVCTPRIDSDPLSPLVLPLFVPIARYRGALRTIRQ
jgi:hypothetical protein